MLTYNSSNQMIQQISCYVEILPLRSFLISDFILLIALGVFRTCCLFFAMAYLYLQQLNASQTNLKCIFFTAQFYDSTLFVTGGYKSLV